MAPWIILVVIGQLMFAVTSLIDKFIVTSKKVSKPFVYAFFVSLLSILSLLIFALGFIPLDLGGFVFPSIYNIQIPDFKFALAAVMFGFSFFYSLYYLYSALAKADASDVVPVITSLSAVGVFILSTLFLGDTLSTNFLLGFILLVAGTFFISHFRFNKEVLILSLLSGIAFSVNITVTKFMFNTTSFDNGFFWSRIGILFAVIFFLVIPDYIEKLFENTKQSGKSGGLWVIGNSIIGGVAGFMVLKAIELGNPTIVQSLAGLQFIFITIISYSVGRLTPVEFGENHNLKDIIQKGIAIVIMSIGFFFLFI